MIYARRNLAAGFTTVRDLGSDDQSVFAVRNAINAGRMIGPRILLSGSAIAVTGGHGDSTPMDSTGDDGARLTDGTCDGPMECRKAVRYQYKLGADVIKFTSTGGFGSNTGLDPQLFTDEIEAIVATAHLRRPEGGGPRLFAGRHQGRRPRRRGFDRARLPARRRGHPDDEEGGHLPGADALRELPAADLPHPDPPSVKLRNEYKAFERAYAAGVKIAFGTDAGTFAHGTNAKEFDLMVGFGMKPMDALRSATVVTADLFGISAEAGTPGGRQAGRRRRGEGQSARPDRGDAADRLRDEERPRRQAGRPDDRAVHLPAAVQ